MAGKNILEDVVGRPVEEVDLDQLALPKKPYLPFHAAVAGEIIDFSKVIVRKLSEEIGAVVGNGRVPQQNDAGLVNTASGLIAVDHVQIFPSGDKKLVIAPSDKGAVGKDDGRIRLPGFGILSHQAEGWSKIIAIAEDAAQHPWSEFLEDSHRIGGLIVRQLGFDAPKVEVDEITDTGLVIVKPHKRMY